MKTSEINITPLIYLPIYLCILLFIFEVREIEPIASGLLSRLPTTELHHQLNTASRSDVAAIGNMGWQALVLTALFNSSKHLHPISFLPLEVEARFDFSFCIPERGFNPLPREKETSSISKVVGHPKIITTYVLLHTIDTAAW